MTTLSYVFRVIKRFGLFKQVDIAGLVEAAIEYQISVIKKTGIRERNIELLKRIDKAVDSLRPRPSEVTTSHPNAISFPEPPILSTPVNTLSSKLIPAPPIKNKKRTIKRGKK